MKSSFIPLSVFFLLIAFSLFAEVNKYGLEVIGSPEKYTQIVKQDSSKKLIDLEEYISDIVLDIRYATENNFTGNVIYELPKAYVRRPVAEALLKVQQELKKMNLGLKIFDAYRPYAATLKFFEVYPDTNFVAVPWKGSRHNRACAVDVSLVDLNSKKEVMMPTEFDNFSEKANPSYMDLPAEAIKNREILIRVMKDFGFTVYHSEWWHFDFEGWKQYEIMDIPFSELE